ncbi:MAG: AAA family ATPase, partial [Desulfuromonadaceae bacterium]
MAQALNILLDTRDPHLARQVQGGLTELEEVHLLNRSVSEAPRGNGSPHIIILHDTPSIDNIVNRIAACRQNFPDTCIFVISTDKSPDHIVEIMKAGAEEYFANSLNLQRLKEAVEKIRLRITNLIQNPKGRLYSFVSSKGGLGSTVIAVNTATALVMGNRGRVSLFDLSLQSGDSSVYLDSLPQTTMADVCKNFHRLDTSLLQASMIHHSSGLHFLPAPQLPEESEAISGAQVRRILQLAKGFYDHVVVDCPSMQIDACSLEAFMASDRIFLLTDLSVPAVRNTARLIQLLQKMKIPEQKIAVVVNRFTKGGPPLHDVELSLQRKIYWFFPNDFEEVIASINSGVPL